jgi:hypothetical protein
VITNADVNVNIGALCWGDLNGSRQASIPKKSEVPFTAGSLFAESGSVITVPVTIENIEIVTAISISMILNDKVESVINVEIPGRNTDELIYNQIGDNLRIGFSSLDPIINKSAQDAILLITLKLKECVSGDVFSVANVVDDFEIADAVAEVIAGARLGLPDITIGNSNSAVNMGNCIPNPANTFTFINYSIPSEGSVKIKIYNPAGGYIKTVVDENHPMGKYARKFDCSDLTEGVYYCVFEYSGLRDVFRLNRKLIVIK